jgi:hypothetical protein
MIKAKTWKAKLNKGGMEMSRGKHFNHKKKGHEPTVGAKPTEKKVFEKVEYAIEPVATAEDLPVSNKAEKDR